MPFLFMAMNDRRQREERDGPTLFVERERNRQWKPTKYAPIVFTSCKEYFSHADQDVYRIAGSKETMLES